jgi:hypothetical protein
MMLTLSVILGIVGQLPQIYNAISTLIKAINAIKGVVNTPAQHADAVKAKVIQTVATEIQADPVEVEKHLAPHIAAIQQNIENLAPSD